MRKLLTFIIIFLSFGNFISRGQMPDRYFFLESYKTSSSGIWMYSNRMIGYNVFSYTSSPYIKWEGGGYFFPLNGSFVTGLYWIKSTLRLCSNKRIQPGVKIKISNFLNGFPKGILGETIWPNIYGGMGFTYADRGFHLTAETGFFRVIKSRRPTVYILNYGMRWKINNFMNVWAEGRYIPGDGQVLISKKNWMDINTGISYRINCCLYLDFGLYYMRYLKDYPIVLLRSEEGILYPAIGFQWQITRPNAENERTEPFFDYKPK